MSSIILPPVIWPDGKRFAFTIFDDCDLQTLENGPPVYEFLYDLGIITAKSVWMLDPINPPRVGGMTCQNPEYAKWVLYLAEKGFTIGLHNVSPGSSNREHTLKGFMLYENTFSKSPRIFANHADCLEAIYWGKKRLGGINRTIYSLLIYMQMVLRHNHPTPAFCGEDEDTIYFWGDICRDKIRYVRNFVCDDINTLEYCPFMPYHDPLRPFVNNWFASTSGYDCKEFCRKVTKDNVLHLEEEGGACIMYTHFGKDFYKDGHLNPQFKEAMEFLATRNGWFVPPDIVLDYLVSWGRGKDISAAMRSELEWKWLKYKATIGKTS
jgi:hypothetical protein